ncbi:MAG: DinB family protein [Chloroflexota bacterium]
MATILVELYRHNRWANLRLLELCAGLSEEQLDLSAPGTYGRVRETLVHLVAAEGRYVAALGGPQSDQSVREGEPIPVVATLREHAGSSGDWLIKFAEESPNGKVLTGTWRDEPYRMAAAQLMVQAINHATEHRAHVVSILTQHGVDVPSLDGWTYGEATGLDRVPDEKRAS